MLDVVSVPTHTRREYETPQETQYLRRHRPNGGGGEKRNRKSDGLAVVFEERGRKEEDERAMLKLEGKLALMPLANITERRRECGRNGEPVCQPGSEFEQCIGQDPMKMSLSTLKICSSTRCDNP